jgi:acetyltransferase-like isoleucine patch superfamily enzyme
VDYGLPPNPYNPLAWIVGTPQVGDGTWIGAFTVIDASGGLTIGRGCDISSGAHVLTHSSAKRCVSERRYDHVDRQPVNIGDYVFVGENATILMGCTIGHHSIVAAGAVVTEGTTVPPYSLVAGVPARIVRSIEHEID